MLNMGAENAKTAWFGGFAGYLLGFYCYVNLPLLHRLLAGMAKVKIAGKESSESSVTHVSSSRVRMTITTIPADWQDVCLSLCLARITSLLPQVKFLVFRQAKLMVRSSSRGHHANPSPRTLFRQRFVRFDFAESGSVDFYTVHTD
ncbi:MAG: hypothetical protein M3Y65_20000 [Pseudomonadota bacterium]|nr:hypothetical protein [Pseudomonadota bacterium]